jgi:hypothetical protein
MTIEEDAIGKLVLRDMLERQQEEEPMAADPARPRAWNIPRCISLVWRRKSHRSSIEVRYGGKKNAAWSRRYHRAKRNSDDLRRRAQAIR